MNGLDGTCVMNAFDSCNFGGTSGNLGAPWGFGTFATPSAAALFAWASIFRGDGSGGSDGNNTGGLLVVNLAGGSATQNFAADNQP